MISSPSSSDDFSQINPANLLSDGYLLELLNEDKLDRMDDGLPNNDEDEEEDEDRKDGVRSVEGTPSFFSSLLQF